MKVLLICKGEYRYFFPGIANALREKHGAQVSAVTFASTAAIMLERSRKFCTVFNLAGWLKSQKAAPDESLQLLQRFELLSGARINTIVHADRILRNYPERETIRILADTLRFWRHICRQYAPGVIIGEVACAAEWIGWLEAHSRSIPYLIPYPAPVAKRFFFLHKPDGAWRSMESAFLAVKDRKLNNHESAAAENFIQSFRATRAKPAFLEWAQHSPLKPQFTRLARRLKRVPFRIRTYLSDGKFEIGSYHGTAPWRPVWEGAMRVARHVASEVRCFERHTSPATRSVYFPLHVQPEFTTDVRAPFHANQLALIENVSKSVPVGYRVVVKEHPGMMGERQLAYYRQLKTLHNVQLLSSRIDSHDLIRSSEVVLTINGSSAWEAILYEKPVIAFGPLCYGFCDLVYRCDDVADLPSVLSLALERFTPRHDVLLKFAWAFLASACELEWGDPVRQPQVTAQSNCERIADAIVAELLSQSQSPMWNTDAFVRR